MARARSTVQLMDLKNNINNRIAHTSDLEARKVLCLLLSDILMAANNYQGFRYTTPGGWNGTEEWKHYYY